MTQRVIPCHPGNYGGVREQTRYLVIHYTAGDGDTARENGLFFSRAPAGASAHWFVDENEAVQSVPEDRIAWHCGADTYVHEDCRNRNSVAVELCSRKEKQGNYEIPYRTLKNGAQLVRQLMKRYKIPAENVLRHYDVTGKQCPAPLVEAGKWRDFLEELMRYETLQDLPLWGRQTVEKLTKRGFLQGDGESLDLSRDMLRLLVILDRAGAFEAMPDIIQKNQPIQE